ncbi:MAG: slipin family protein [Dehalococcoidales bacterium]|jgi:regulator of protease activity HflC (stomatin/prohibitin superfamily)|nr:slipin family protein [Dehalococcoidales bacterium]MDP7109592.1 slipin family protein [Dehalococcoidales bacterium]MDP7310079.1 slipin family protein [Dehalococcoidales bacterium]MDP7409601.1 slipin family protein [Dehalococcoidales bacterium]MDP7675935.1 slipin family protein [Dehalococcoidales bacterium]
MVLVGVIVFALIIILPSAIKIVSEWERGVILRLGRLVGARGPGFFVIIPFVDRMIKVDLRTLPMDVPPQDVITKDNVTVRVDAVVYFRVIDPEAAVVKITDHIRATSLISQTTLRNVLGQSELDELLAQREMLNQNLQKIIDEQTDPWGVKVSIVEIKNVELPEAMRRSMASQAEAERERRAKIIHADGEFQASEKLAQAGAVVGQEPATLQLRYLQTLVEICSEKNSTIVFPLPIDLIGMFLKKQPPTS